MADTNNDGNMENTNQDGLARGDDVSVIPAGEFQLFDPNNDILYRPGQVTNAKMSRFIEDQLALGNLKIVGSEGAPQPKEGVEAQDVGDPDNFRADEAGAGAYETDPKQVQDGDVGATKQTGDTKKSRRTV